MRNQVSWDRSFMTALLEGCGFMNVGKLKMKGYKPPEVKPQTDLLSFYRNVPPPFPTPGVNRKAAKRRAGVQYRHGKAARQ